MAKGRPLSTRARAALAWGLLWFALGQGAFRARLHHHPEIADREFGRKHAGLRRVVSEAPARPLVLMLGSSRVATGFRPGVLRPEAGDLPSAPLAYNFAQVGSGPEMAHLTLHRLLASGVRPDWVLVEFWPPTWSTERDLREFADQINLGCLGPGDVRLLGRYVKRPGKLYRAWLSAQAVPLYTHRSRVLGRLLPDWVRDSDRDDRRCRDLDPLGWWSPTRSVDPDEHQRLEARYERIYAPRLRRFQVARTPDRALRAILDVCRREGIRASLVVLPEGRGFRGLYPASTLRAVDAYLGRLERDCRVTVIDARTWVGDDGFIDGHHLLPEGALAFTRRLGAEVLGPGLSRGSTRLLR